MYTKSRWATVANIGRILTFRDRDKSPAEGVSIWEGCNQLAMLDPAVGFGIFEDFICFPLDDTTRNPAVGVVSSDTAADALTLPKVAGGVIQLATGAVDNNETYFQWGGPNQATPAPFSITDAGGDPLWFECRVKALEHADLGVFIGLAEENCAGANFLADNSGVVADKDFIGFNILTASPAAWNATWRKNGQAVQTIAAAAVNADDWHTFGFVFDGVSTVTFYIDGVASATVATTSAATFPSAQLLAPIVAIKTGEGVLKRVQVDYIKVVQVR